MFTKDQLKSPAGFPDMTPGQAIQLYRMIEVIKRNYELSGFVPIETPIVERVSIISAKSEGEINTQIYGLRLLNTSSSATNDAKDLALRFDQTVPLARYVSANMDNIFFPFRRYVIGPVFRGERPKDGRYRQFIQADIDVIGNESLSIFHDAEIVSVITNIFKELKIGKFTVRIGHRKILNGMLQFLELDENLNSKAIGVIDKLEKIGQEKVIESLESLGVSNTKTTRFIDTLRTPHGIDEYLDILKNQDMNPLFNEGVMELEQVVNSLRSLGVEDQYFKIDISIARGLEYYTGIVYETRLDSYPDLGSIASGGRFDNLAGIFSNRSMPGVGMSIGVTRLLLRLIKIGLISDKVSTVAKVLVTTAEPLSKYFDKYLDFTNTLRKNNIPAEVYLDEKSLGKQMEFANKRGFDVVVIARTAQIENDSVIVRNLKNGEQTEVNSSNLVEAVLGLLG